MISNEQILNQIEKQIHKAKMETNELATREAFAAIRALCDVVLDSTASVNPIQSAPVISAPPITLKEADANGESLFDF
ncbi:uracil-DNA glycosylase [Psychrobacillus glaciei]|uniref:Uracil-DNA glycosylase n=1 Tax=Psychrobacillus glaciei TaxID=2283160 RepID=A0A5J6SJP1_9BACI|nr:YwdI family protein [Psychrobacillus glaciei]QFF97879.1 uracil-DNA glycosylase [Psychrobacillus glaciei]